MMLMQCLALLVVRGTHYTTITHTKTLTQEVQFMWNVTF